MLGLSFPHCVQLGLLELISPGSSALLPWQVTLPVIDLACPCSYCPKKINKERGLEGHDQQQGLAATPPGDAGPLGGGLAPGSCCQPPPPGAKEGA